MAKTKGRSHLCNWLIATAVLLTIVGGIVVLPITAMAQNNSTQAWTVVNNGADDSGDDDNDSNLPAPGDNLYDGYDGVMGGDQGGRHENFFSRHITGMIEDTMFGLWVWFRLEDPITLIYHVSPENVYDKLQEGVDDGDGVMSELFSAIIRNEFIGSATSLATKLMTPDPDDDEAMAAHSFLHVDPEAEDTFLFMFSSEEGDIIGLAFAAFNRFLRIPYIVAFAIVGVLILLKGISSDDRERTTMKQLVGGLFLFPLILRVFPVLLEPFFWFNYAVVRAMRSLVVLVGEPDLLEYPIVTLFAAEGIGGVGFIGGALATIVLFVAMSLLNFQYTIRRLMLSALLIMFPIVAFLQIFPGTRDTLRMWFTEFTSNLFLQSAHAIVYFIFISLIFQTNISVLPVIGMLVTLTTLGTFVRRMMGCQRSETDSIAGGMIGVGALMGVGRVAGSLFRNGSRLTSPRSSPGDSSPEGAGAAKTGFGAAATGASSGKPAEARAGVDATKGQEELGTRISQRSPVWDEDGIGTKVAKGAAMGGLALAAGAATAAGALAGSAALGPSGLGTGAALGAGAAGAVGAAGMYGANLLSKQAATQLMEKNRLSDTPIGRQYAAVRTSTGLDMAPGEVPFYEPLYNKHMMSLRHWDMHEEAAAMDNAYAGIRYDDERLMGVDGGEGYTSGAIRRRADDLHARLSNSNTGMSADQIHQKVLSDEIRPSMMQRAHVLNRMPEVQPAEMPLGRPSPTPPRSSLASRLNSAGGGSGETSGSNRPSAPTPSRSSLASRLNSAGGGGGETSGSNRPSAPLPRSSFASQLNSEGGSGVEAPVNNNKPLPTPPRSSFASRLNSEDGGSKPSTDKDKK